MTDTSDWRGSIAIPPKTKNQRNRETNSIAQSLAHKRRQAAGCNMSRAGGQWARAIHNAAISAAIEGRE